MASISGRDNSDAQDVEVTKEVYDEPRTADAMDDVEVRQITDKYIQESASFCFDELGEERDAAMRYYLGLPEGDLAPPTIPDRSSVVSTDVSDTIEWLLPALLSIFTAGPSVVEFVPRKEGDEDAAAQATEYLNYVFYQQNPGWHELYTWFKDALIQKVGIMKVWWDGAPEEVTEFYRGLTEDQFLDLLEDDAIEPTEHTAYPDPAALHQQQAQYAQAVMLYSEQQAMIKALVSSGFPQNAAEQAASVTMQQRTGPQMQGADFDPQAQAHQAQAAQAKQQAAQQQQAAAQQQAASAAQQKQTDDQVKKQLGQQPPQPPQPPQGGPGGAPGAAPPAGPQAAGGPQGGPPQPPQAQLLKPPKKPNPRAVPQLHDLKLKRTKTGGRIRIAAVPGEEFLIHPDCTTARDGFTAHRVKRTVSYVTQRYPDVDPDDLTSDLVIPAGPTGAEIGTRDARYALQNNWGPLNTDPTGRGDDSMREVWLTECYLPIDEDGDGVAEWRMIVRAGNAILEDVEIDGPPWATLCPVPIPHVFFGRSEAELAMPSQRTKTHILRNALDNLAFQTNARTFAVDNMVNLDDLLTNRPGGVVRMKQPGMAGPLSSAASDPAAAMQMLQYADDQKQDSTGVTKYTQGSDSDTLNKTATGLQNITNRADMRVELVARIFAETGVKDLFWLMLKLSAQYQDKPAVVRLTGKWVNVDPREWWNRFDMTVNVGLGTGNKDVAIQRLTQIQQLQQAAAQAGYCTPKNMYNAAVKMCAVLGFKDADQFFTDPANMPPPPPPPPDPTLAATQAQTQAALQIEAAKNETDKNKALLQAQIDSKKADQEDERQRDHDATQFAIQREELLFKFGVHPLYEGITFITTYNSNAQALGGQPIARPSMGQFAGIPGVPQGSAIPMQPNPGNPGGGVPGGPTPPLPTPGAP